MFTVWLAKLNASQLDFLCINHKVDQSLSFTRKLASKIKNMPKVTKQNYQ